MPRSLVIMSSLLLTNLTGLLCGMLSGSFHTNLVAGLATTGGLG